MGPCIFNLHWTQVNLTLFFHGCKFCKVQLKFHLLLELFSVSMGVTACTHHLAISHINYILPLLIPHSPVHGILSLPSGYKLTGTWKDILSARHCDGGQWEELYFISFSQLQVPLFTLVSHSTSSPGALSGDSSVNYGWLFSALPPCLSLARWLCSTPRF